MTDLELTRLCAEAMGIYELTGQKPIWRGADSALGWTPPTEGIRNYDPLHDDAQAMALVRRFRLLVDGGNAAAWCVHGDVVGSGVIADDLNRAIVECVAKMQAAKVSA